MMENVGNWLFVLFWCVVATGLTLVLWVPLGLIVGVASAWLLTAGYRKAGNSGNDSDSDDDSPDTPEQYRAKHDAFGHPK